MSFFEEYGFRLLLGASFVILVIVFYCIRKRLKVEFKNTDFTLAFIPIFLVLLFNGNIEEFDFFGIRGKFRRTFEENVDDVYLDTIEIEDLKEVNKTNVSRIPILAQYNPEALAFNFGKTYDENDIERFIREIPSLSYFIIRDSSKVFFGLISLKDYMKLHSESEFIAAIQDSNISKLKQYPKLLTVDKAIEENISRKDALYFMDSVEVAILPVVNMRNKTLKGVVRYNRLSKGLLKEIYKDLE